METIISFIELFILMPNFKKCVFVDDLLALTLYSSLAIVFVLIPPFNETFLRVFFVLPLFIFVPGYAFIAALFPGKEEITSMERFTLSFAFSIVLTVFDGYLISLLPSGYRPAPITISILGMTTFFSIIAIFSRKLLGENDQFSFSVNEFIKSIKYDDTDENKKLDKTAVPLDRRHPYLSKTKLKIRNLKSYLDMEIERIALSPDIRNGLVIGLIVLIILFSGLQICLISILPSAPRPSSIVISFLAVTIFLCIIAISIKKLLKNYKFSYPINEFTEAIDEIGKNSELKEVSVSVNKKNPHRVESKKADHFIPKLYLMIKKAHSLPNTEKKLIIGLTGLIIIFSSVQIYLLNILSWSPRPSSIIISLFGVIILLSITVVVTSKLLKNHQFSSINEFIKYIASNNSDENNTFKGLCFFTDKARQLKSQFNYGITTTSLPPEIEKGLIIGLIISIILVSGVQVYAKATQEKEAFTALYILGPEGKAEGYPTESLFYVPINVTVGIENHELRDIVYVLQMKADERVIQEMNIPLANEETWQKNMTYTRQELKTGRSKLEFALFKQKPDYLPYRSVHLYIHNNNSIASVDPQKYAEIPPIDNGEMEFSTGWEFTSNTYKITGSYANNSGINSSSAYRIENSFEGNLSDLPEYGEISQNIECKGDTMVVLSAHVKSNSRSSSQDTVTQEEYVTVNGETVWTGEINENEGWQHLIVPISLRAGSNNLTLGLKQTYGKISPLEILWDNITLNSLADLSLYPAESNTLEANPPTSTVLSLPTYTSSNTFSVSWNGTDDVSGIAYYSVESSTDGVNWEPWISRTTDTLSVFTGEHNKTYYFRSKAVDNAGNVESAHASPDTKTKVYTGTPIATLDISPNPCKGATNITVSYPVPLTSVICRVSRDGFRPETGELVSTDGITWTGGYIARYGNHFYVEAVCTDVYGNTIPVLGEIYVDTSMPDFEIEANPDSIDTGDLDIKVTPSTALKKEPSVSISANEQVNVTYLSYSDGDYYYTADIKSEINEGEHKISVSGTDLSSEEVVGNTTFVVNHSG